MPLDLGVFHDVKSDFHSFSFSTVDGSGNLTSRSQGGLAFLSLENFCTTCQLVSFDDAKLLDLKFASQGREILEINV